jgi:hypothetical protein
MVTGIYEENIILNKGVMKKGKIILYLLLIVILSFSTYGQEPKQTVNKVEFRKLPSKVKKQVNSLKGFKITNSFSVIENNEKVYKIVLDDGETTFDLMMDKNGNIIGKEEDYL